MIDVLERARKRERERGVGRWREGKGWNCSEIGVAIY